MKGAWGAAAAAVGVWLAMSACSLPFSSGTTVGLGSKGPVKVALVDVFSGNSGYGYLGPYLKNSLQVEIDDLNAAGGLLGAQIQLVTADDGYDMTRTPEVVKQLLSDSAVKLLVGPSFAGLYLGAKPLIEKAQVPNCVTAMYADDVMRTARFTFRAQEADTTRLGALLSYIRKNTQMKKVGLIADDDGVGHGYDGELSDQAGKAGLQYIGAAFAAATGDHKAQVQQMMQRGAEAVILSSNPSTAAKTLQAIKLLNATTRLKAFGFNSLASYDWVQQLGDPGNGVVFESTVQAYLSDVPEARWSPAYRNFSRQTITRYGTAPNRTEMQGIAAGADCITEWAKAVQAARDFNGTDVVKAWETLDIPAAESVLGVHEQFSRTDHDAVPPDGLCIYQWVKNSDKWGLRLLSGPGP
jgi:branched-chain amino acid transport system substrate-binding protein